MITKVSGPMLFVVVFNHVIQCIGQNGNQICLEFSFHEDMDAMI
jgi:hypothetical protein